MSAAPPGTTIINIPDGDGNPLLTVTIVWDPTTEILQSVQAVNAKTTSLRIVVVVATQERNVAVPAGTTILDQGALHKWNADRISQLSIATAT